MEITADLPVVDLDLTVRVGDPVDLSKRLCGTPQIRRPAERTAS